MTLDESTMTVIDEYFCAHTIVDDPVLQSALARAESAGLPDQSVAANQAALLSILARSVNAKSVLEIGTLAGYSTIWLARSVSPGGMVITLEANDHHARIAEQNVAAAELENAVRLIVGPAIESLASLTRVGSYNFDFVFIDADKENNARYMDFALRMSHSGTLIVVDNIVRGGAVLDSDSTDPRVAGVRSLMTMIANEERVAATVIQTVGVKGHDGFLIARVK